MSEPQGLGEGRWYVDERGDLVDLTTPYRIGWRSRHRPWRLRRPWQSESRNLRFARRGFTAAGAQRKMLRDVAYEERTGQRSPWQRWRRWRADLGLGKNRKQADG